MDMSVIGEGSFWRRVASPAGFTAVADTFVMEWAAVVRDIVLGLLIAGMAAAWIPDTFWQQLFLTGHPLATKLWDRSSARWSPSRPSCARSVTCPWPRCCGTAASASAVS
jgi:uncharacterized membrane protein YraQ (UPF0718 family)